VQETLLRAARYRRGLTRPERLQPWLLRIASNVLADQARRDRRRRRLGTGEDGLSEAVSGEPPPEELADEPEVWVGGQAVPRCRAILAVRSALERAPEADRIVLAAYYGAGESCRDTAERVRIDPELVKVRLFRARTRLRSALRGAFGSQVTRRAS
jgi:RNA polymerase sigma-70 factor, ECF subfamily